MFGRPPVPQQKKILMAKKRRRTDLGPCRCPYRITDPAQAGYVSWDRLAEAARAFPHLKPCGREAFAWIDRQECNFCPEGLREHEGSGA